MDRALTAFGAPTLSMLTRDKEHFVSTTTLENTTVVVVGRDHVANTAFIDQAPTGVKSLLKDDFARQRLNNPILTYHVKETII